MALQISIVSSKGQLWQGEGNYVGLTTGTGSIGILKGHQPLLATVEPGEIIIHTEKDDKISVPVGTGLISLDNDKVIIVVEDPNK